MYIFEKTMVLIDEFKCNGVNYSILKIQLMHGRHVCIYQSVLRNICVNNSCMNYACKQYQNFFYLLQNECSSTKKIFHFKNFRWCDLHTLPLEPVSWSATYGMALFKFLSCTFIFQKIYILHCVTVIDIQRC